MSCISYKSLIRQRITHVETSRSKGETINKEYYLSIMGRLRKQIRLKRPDSWKENHEPPSHKAIIVNELQPKNSKTILVGHTIHLIWVRPTFFVFHNSNYYLRHSYSFDRKKTVFKKCFDELVVLRR